MATNPSLLIVPYRFKAAKLYSQLPESGAGDFTVTRSTTATRTNASGLLESVASGVPRLDYTGGGCPALLVEPAATNLFLRSEEFDNAAWIKTAVTVSGNTVVAPNGTTTADEVFDTATESGHAINQTATVVSGSISASIYIKGITRRYVGVRLFVPTNGIDVGRHSIVVDTTNGAITATLTSGQPIANIQSRVEALPSGWYRVTLSGTSPAGSASIMAWHSPSATPVNDGFATSVYVGQNLSFAVWGAQLETGSVATSYIQTVAATQTRNADVISVSSVSGLIGQTQGTIYAEISATNFADGSSIFTISDGTANNRITLQKQSSSRLRAIVTTASGTVADISTVSGQVTGTYKIAFAYAANDFVLYVNGTQIGTDTSGAVPATSKVNFGSSSTDTTQFNDRIRAAAIYTSRLSNAELETLTTL